MARYAMVGSGSNARPVPKKMAAVIERCLNRSGATLTSCLRTQAAVNFAREHGAVLSSQKELYDGYQAGLPGYNPANPPGQSTHERRSDGVAYPGPVGRPLFGWQVGQDVSDSDAYIEAAREEGWIAVRPYSSSSEYHHVNFMKQPFFGFRDLKRGSKGRRVVKLERRLKFLGFGKGMKIDRTFGPETVKAVKAFQKKRGLTVDGIVGAHTWKQLTVDFRREYKRRK